MTALYRVLAFKYLSPKIQPTAIALVHDIANALDANFCHYAPVFMPALLQVSAMSGEGCVFVCVCGGANVATASRTAFTTLIT